MQHVLLFSLFLTLATFGVVHAQQLPSTCEGQLARLQGRFDLVNISREQGEQIAGGELGNLRKRNADLEAQVKAKDAELEKLKPTPPEKPTSPPAEGS